MKKNFGYYVAYTISTVFHPILIIPFFLLVVHSVNPYVLGAKRDPVLLANILLFSVFFPGLAVVIMKLSGMISSTNLKKQSDRIGPYIVSIVFYIWLFLNLRNQAKVGEEIKVFTLGVCVSLCLGFFINVFSKISIHTMSWGGLFGQVLLLWQYYGHDDFILTLGNSAWQIHMLGLLLFILIIAAAVASSRLVLKAHLLHQVYGGFLVGILAQIIALRLIT